jgi:hypothetical protein
VTGDEADAIQAVFAAIVEDQLRNEQICADVHHAVAGGPSPVVP